MLKLCSKTFAWSTSSKTCQVGSHQTRIQSHKDAFQSLGEVESNIAEFDLEESWKGEWIKRKYPHNQKINIWITNKNYERFTKRKRRQKKK
jgi:hypothetical protein